MLASYHAHSSVHQFYDYIDYGRQDNTEQKKGFRFHTREDHHNIQPLEQVVLICKTFDK